MVAGLSIADLGTAIRRNDLAAKDCVNHFHSLAVRFNDHIQAFTEIAGDCQQSEDIYGPLTGIPIAIKDGICTRDFHTTACSKMLKKFRSPYDATVVSRLKQQGAFILGKTNMDEFAMGSSTESSSIGLTRNPWNSSNVPGGSSGGSAAAVAARMVPAALGSDTGGSIRQPASFCGISGLKPTYGLVSRYGLIAFASSLDQIGPMARSAEDCAVVLNAIAGHDPLDSTSSTIKTPDYLENLNHAIAGTKIGVCRNQMDAGIDSGVASAVEEAIRRLAELDVEIVDIELPYEEYSVAAYYIVAPCEASSNLSRYDGVRCTTRAEADRLNTMYTKTRSENFGPEVKRRILLGTYALSSGYYDQYYVKASKVRRLIKQDFERAFENVDLIAGPTTPTTAFEFGEKVGDPIQMYLADVFTVSANLAGIPAMSIPCGFADGLPVGLQLQGPAFSEARILNVAHQFQKHTDWHLRSPEHD